MKKIIAVFLAFLLTGTLVLFCVSFVGRQAIAPAMSAGGAQVSESVFRKEEQLVRERVTALADLYGFEAEPVISSIGEETLRDLNSQSALWWNTLLQDGETGKEINWNTKAVEQALMADARLSGMEDLDRSEYLASSAAEDIHTSIIRIVLPMRQQTIRLGMRAAGKRIDVPNLVTFFLGVPWAALALCALLAGLIALLAGRPLAGALQYIGSAFGAAAIVIIALIILYQCAGILPMIREASASLTIQYQSVESGALIRAGILAAVMAAGCVFCLRGNRKNRKTA